MGSRPHKVIQMGIEVVLSSLLPEINIYLFYSIYIRNKFLFHLMESEGQFIVLSSSGIPLQ